MSISNDYRQNAAHCIRLSQATPDRDRKISFIDMAQSWLSLAEQVERRPVGLLGSTDPALQRTH